MFQDTISSHAAQRFYDRVGARYDWFGVFESRAKAWALDLLDLRPGHQVLVVGTGTGKEQVWARKTVTSSGFVAGVDLSPVMLGVAQGRNAGALCRGDVRHLPFAGGRFDRLLAAYVLDLLPLSDLPGVLTEFRRVLRRPARVEAGEAGRLVVISLTEGVDPASRAMVGLWKRIYAASPVACGGCRPLQIKAMVCQAGFEQVRRQVIVQLGIPSEIVVALAGPEEEYRADHS